jgi:hypothetical protein
MIDLIRLEKKQGKHMGFFLRERKKKLRKILILLITLGVK